MHLSRVAFGQIPFDVRPTRNSDEFLILFDENGPNALNAMAAIDKDKGQSYVLSHSAMTGGNSTPERAFTVTVTPETDLDKLKNYLTKLFEPIGEAVSTWWS